MFDIVSVPRKQAYEKAIEKGTEPEEFFDAEFYQNQQENRTQYIETSKVTEEFKVEVERQQKKASNVESRRMSALGVSTAVCYEDQYESSTVSSQTS